MNEAAAELPTPDLVDVYALIGDDTTPALERIARAQWLITVIENDMRVSIRDARFAGASWADVAQFVGVSRQAAHERFRDLD